MTNKEKFIEYCKGRIVELGEVNTPDQIFEDEGITYRVIMTADSIQDFTDVKIVTKYGVDNFLVVKDNKVVINTPMVDPIWYTSLLEFKEIDPSWYDAVLRCWDEIDMDEWMEKED
jgi:hypothetical protein